MFRHTQFHARFACIAAFIVLLFGVTAAMPPIASADPLQDELVTIQVRVFTDGRCLNQFNEGTDYPLTGTTVEATLPGGRRMIAIADEKGIATISSIKAGILAEVQINVDDNPPLPTWMQAQGLGVERCNNAMIKLHRERIGLMSSVLQYNIAFRTIAR